MFARKMTEKKDKDKEGYWENRKPSKSNTFFKYKCHRCHKRGHKAADCRKSKNTYKTKYESSKICEEQLKSEDSLCNEVVFLQTNTHIENNKIWCLDSGCTSHMCSNRSNFLHLKGILKPLNLANGKTTKIMGIGEVKFAVDNGNSKQDIKLQDVMFVPELRTNLMSVAKITENGFNVNFSKNGADVTDPKGKIIISAKRHGNLYYVSEFSEKTCLINEERESISEWHRKLGHVNMKYLAKMMEKQLIPGPSLKNIEAVPTCEICVRSKLTQLPFREKSEPRTTELLEIVHSDVFGPTRTASLSGARYFVTFIDDRSRWCEIYFMKNKNEVLEKFEKYKAYAENHTGETIKYLQTDNGTEYINTHFDEFLTKNGIRRRLTVPHTPQQNGLSERKNRTLVETARSLLLDANMSPMLWAEAVNTANYIRNRCPCRSLDGETPYKLWMGTEPNVRYFKVFGAKVFFLEKGERRNKFAAKSKEAIFIGYSTEAKAYRLYLPNERKVIVSRDVKFFNKFGSKETFENFSNQEPQISEIDYEPPPEESNAKIEVTLYKSKNKEQHDNLESKTNEQNIVELERIHGENTKKEKVIDITNNLEVEMPSENLKKGRGRPKFEKTGKKGRPKKIYCQADDSSSSKENLSDAEYESANLIVEPDPMTIDEAFAREDADEWKKAVIEEYVAHVINKTWDIVDRADGENVVGNRFVFTTKFDSAGRVEKRKARLVARGFAQLEGIDYNETFAPVLRLGSLRLLMAIAAKEGWAVHQMDVTTAYLNGELYEKVYMELPDQLLQALTKIKDDQKYDGETRKKIKRMV